MDVFYKFSGRASPLAPIVALLSNMSTADSDPLSFTSTALVSVPSTSTPQEGYPQLASKPADDFWIAFDGFDEFNEDATDDFTMKEEGQMEYSSFTPDYLFGSTKEEASLANQSSVDEVKTAVESDLYSIEGVLGMLFGEDQSLATFPGLQLTDDVYVSANRESAVDIFPVWPLRETELILLSRV